MFRRFALRLRAASLCAVWLGASAVAHAQATDEATALTPGAPAVDARANTEAPADPEPAPSSPTPHAPNTRPLAQAVSVESGASCLDATRLVEHIAMWLGRDRIARTIRIEARGDERDAHRISFQLTDGPRVARRVFESSPEICGDMHAVVGLAIALAIDAQRLSEVVPAAETAAPPKRHVGVLLMSLGYEALPGLSLGAMLGGEVGLASWLNVRMDGIGHYSRNDTLGGANGHFDALLVASALSLCGGGWVEPTLHMSLCMGAGAGLVYAAGRDFAPNRSDVSPWLATLGGVRMALVLGIPWVLDLTVITPLLAPRYEAGPVGSPSSVRHSSSGAFLFGLGPALTF